MSEQPETEASLLTQGWEGPLLSLGLKKGSPTTTWAEDRICQGIPNCGRKLKKRKIPLRVAEWNVRTLLDNEPQTRPQHRTAIIAHELNRYNVDIAALSETRLPGEDSLTEVGEGYTYYWKVYEENERKIHGVGFAIRNKLLTKINSHQWPYLQDC